MDTWKQRILWTAVSLIAVSMASGCESNCGDGVDDDDDGYVDCEDRECFGDPDYCATEINCFDELDNDADGEIDCLDSDCSDEVLGPNEIDCGDLRDDDCDGLVDCEDPDCSSNYYCSYEDYCDDGRDNDGDGLADCDDPDCAGGYYCNEATQCFDGYDNDGDGLVDCEDPDCSWDYLCDESANCGDSFDNDADGLIDCADPDCEEEGHCGSESMACNDARDNDSDGLVDCEDPDCSGNWDCDEGWHCDDYYDNDRDGLVDCEDPDCAWSVACDERANCFDELDNDGDGLIDCLDSDCADLEECHQTAGYWELFDEDEGPPDLIGLGIRFEPDETDENGYSYTVFETTPHLPIDPGSGDVTTQLELDNDAFTEHRLSESREVVFYGETYSSLFVSSNGYVTFDAGSDSRSTSPARHFAFASVAGYRSNLNPETVGWVGVDESEEVVAVTYNGVIAVGNSSPNVFQILLFADGVIELHFIELATLDALVGISSGGEVYPPETDFVP